MRRAGVQWNNLDLKYASHISGDDIEDGTLKNFYWEERL